MVAATGGASKKDAAEEGARCEGVDTITVSIDDVSHTETGPSLESVANLVVPNYLGCKRTTCSAGGCSSRAGARAQPCSASVRSTPASATGRRRFRLDRAETIIRFIDTMLDA